jgi:hypothetical protein
MAIIKTLYKATKKENPILPILVAKDQQRAALAIREWQLRRVTKKIFVCLLPVLLLLGSCSTTQKGQTIVHNGKHSRIVLGNPRKFAEKARRDSAAAAKKYEFSNGHK